MTRLHGLRARAGAAVAAGLLVAGVAACAAQGTAAGGGAPAGVGVQSAQLYPHQWGGNWTAFDNGYRLNLSVGADRIGGKVYYLGYYFDAGGTIDKDGKVDGWVTGVPWGTRYLRGTMPHLQLETLARVNGANFTMQRGQY
jgi:hypothetical protein